MRLVLIAIVFGHLNILFSQETTDQESEYEFLINHTNCFSANLYIPSKSDLWVAVIDEDDSYSDNNIDHFYLKFTGSQKKIFLNTLNDSEILDHVYILSHNETDSGDYMEINTGEYVDFDETDLIIQFDISSPCHNDIYFLLMTDKNESKKLLNQLSNKFEQNEGFKKLIQLMD